MEIWMDIEGYEGMYQISDHGRAKSLGNSKTKKEKIRKYSFAGDSRKYYGVILSKNGKTKLIKIHRLVAQHFIPNPHNLPQVNHIDNDPFNNHVSNLEWCTGRENKNHGMTFKKTSSNYPGVCWHKGSERWRSRITVNGKRKHLGSFVCEIEAATAYQEELLKIKN